MNYSLKSAQILISSTVFRLKTIHRYAIVWINRISPFTGMWDAVLFLLALLLGFGVALLADGDRLASTPFAHWVSRGDLTEPEANSVFNSIGTWMAVFSSIGLVIFFMAYPPRPWRISPYRLRIFVITSLMVFAVGTTLWFNGDSLASLDALQSRFPGNPDEIELAVYLGFISMILGVVSIIVLWFIWASRGGSRIANVGYGSTSLKVSPGVIAKQILTLIAVVFVILIAFHWFNGSGGLTDAPRMAFSDFKVAAKCPHKPATVLRFIQRSPWEAMGIGVAAVTGEDWVAEVCNGLMDDE